VYIGDDMSECRIRASRVDRCPECASDTPMDQISYEENSFGWSHIFWCKFCGTIVSRSSNGETINVPTRKN